MTALRTVYEAEPGENDTAVIARLAALPPLDFERVRKEEAKAIGVSVQVLDVDVKAARNKETAAERMPFTDVEPWGEPVDPASLSSARQPVSAS